MTPMTPGNTAPGGTEKRSGFSAFTVCYTIQGVRVIQHNSATPMYIQIFERLQQQIRLGEIKGGEKLPSERELGIMYKASRITIRQALDMLQNNGLTFAVQGKGTFVKRPQLNVNLMRITSFAESIKETGLDGATRLLRFTKNAPIEKYDRLAELKNWKNGYCLELTGHLSEKPVVYYRSYIRKDIGAKIYDLARERADRQEVFSTFSLYADIGCKILRITQEIFAEEADAFLHSILEVPVGKALLKTESFAFDEENQPVEYKTAYYRADKYSFSLVRENIQGSCE